MNTASETSPDAGLPAGAPTEPAGPHHDTRQTDDAYRRYVACFTDPTQALLHLADTAGIAVAYLDRGCIEAERGGPLTDEQWDDLTYQLDDYDGHVSFDDTNAVFLDQIFSDANVPRYPEDEDDADEPRDDETGDRDHDQGGRRRHDHDDAGNGDLQ